MIVYVISWLRQTDGTTPTNGVNLNAYNTEEDAKKGLEEFLNDERDLWISSPDDKNSLTVSINDDGMYGVLHDRWYTDTLIAKILDVEVVQ